MSSHRTLFAPPEGHIERGTVVRVEPYGAFVQLSSYRTRGLVHISALTNYKVENVEDVVSINDLVWVKVLNVTEETDAAGRTRHKVQLSMKDVNQEDGTDIANSVSRQDAQSQAIQQNLSSSIGLGFAEDPMAHIGSSSSLVFKHEKDKNKTLIRGYALLDDDEGEESAPLVAAEQPMGRGRGVPPSQQTVDSTKSLGRGRGMTLPAWMTKQKDGPGQPEDLRNDKRENNLSSDESSSRREKKRRKKHERSSRESRHRDRKHSKKHRRDDRKKDRRRRSESESDQSRERTRKRSRRDDRKRSRRSRSYSESSGSVDGKFQNVEEAQSIIARLEKAKKNDGGK